MSDYILYVAIGAGIAFVFFVLIKLFSGREKKSKVYSIPKDQQIFAQSTELFDPSLQTKKNIRAAAKDFKLIGEIVEFMEQGKKLEAIKHVQQKENISLSDAKAIVDQAEEIMQRMPSLFQSKQNNGMENNNGYKSQSTGIDNELIELISKGNLIGAIKVYRDATDVSLLQAKEYCEELASKHNLRN